MSKLLAPSFSEFLTEEEMRQVFAALHERESQLIAYINHEMLPDDGYSREDLANTSSARRKLYAYDWCESEKREAWGK